MNLQEKRAIDLELIIKMSEGNQQLIKDALAGRIITYPSRKLQTRYDLIRLMFKGDFALRETIKYYMERETQ